MSLIIPVAIRSGNNIIPPPTVGGTIYALSLDSSNNSFIGGSFLSVGGQGRIRIAQILENQNVNLTFNPGATSIVYDIVYNSSDNKVYVGGSFSNIASTPVPFLARLLNDSTGTFDSFFTSPPNGRVDRIMVDTDGSVFIGGAFTQVGGVARTRLAAFNSSGNLTAFQSNANNNITGIKTDPSATANLIVCGSFTSIRGSTRRGLAKVVKATGVVTTFNANALLPNNTAIRFMEVGGDGSIYIGGRTIDAGYTDDRILKISNAGALMITYAFPANRYIRSGTIDASGNILAAWVSFSDPSDCRLYRFDGGGVVDTTFNTVGYVQCNGLIERLALTSTGDIVVVGAFTTINAQSRTNYAVLDSTGAVV